MRQLTHLALVFVLIGCGGASTEVAHAPDSNRADERPRDLEPIESVPVETVDPSGRAPGTCPERFGVSTPSCDEHDTPSECHYPEGTCSCSTPVWCGGMAPPPMPVTWTCEATPTPCAAPGTPCTSPGRCSHGGCGWSGVECVEGRWTPYMTSPPP